MNMKPDMADRRQNKLFTAVEPPDRLFSAVLGRIDRERLGSLLARRAASLVIAALSFASFAAASAYSVGRLRQSGAGQYLSLLVSDGGAVLLFWRDYVQSLAEAMPLAGIAACLLSLFIFLGALKVSARYLNGPRGFARPV